VIRPIAQEDVNRYGDILAEVKARVDYAVEVLQSPAEEFDLECAAMHLRKSVELIVLGSLVANRMAVEKVASAIHSKRWDVARGLVRSINPDYWPVPLHIEIDHNGRTSFVAVTDPILNESEVGRAWGFLSDLLHARNPYSDPIDLRNAADRILDIAQRIATLLSLHSMDLGNADFLIIGQVNLPPDGGTEVRVLTRGDQFKGFIGPSSSSGESVN
jgi:hypothetical protein